MTPGSKIISSAMEKLDMVRIHYATLGQPHRDASGQIDNAVLVLHWTGSDSRVLLTPPFMTSLFDTGRQLDAKRYFLIFADTVVTAGRASQATACGRRFRRTGTAISSICNTN